jgi:hypothetical protein
MLEIRVLWNGCFSVSFITYNGVKQGGICSATFFSIYIDDLLLGLKSLNVGCFVGQLFYGCLAYADDIFLMAPTLSALRLMLNFCTLYANDNDIVFNPIKSLCIHFSLRVTSLVQFEVYLQGSKLTWTDKLKHLGHTLHCTLNDFCDISCQQNTFVSQFNYFMSRFCNVNIIFKVKLFMNYCESFYGCQLWDLQHSGLNCFDTIWRKSIRRLWQIPYRSHCNFLPVFANGTNFRVILNKRFANFATNCINHTNCLISFITQIAASSQLHSFGKNLHFVNNYCLPDIPPTALCACELAFIRAGLLCVEGFSNADVQFMLSCTCCW